MARNENWHGRKKISQTEEERQARMRYLRTIPGIIGDKFDQAQKSVEELRKLSKDICKVKYEMSQVNDKDIWIRAVLGSETIIDRMYNCIKVRKGALDPNYTITKQIMNEVQFHDYLMNKLNDIYIAEYHSNYDKQYNKNKEAVCIRKSTKSGTTKPQTKSKNG